MTSVKLRDAKRILIMVIKVVHSC